jgi:hypothetical protein
MLHGEAPLLPLHLRASRLERGICNLVLSYFVLLLLLDQHLSTYYMYVVRLCCTLTCTKGPNLVDGLAMLNIWQVQNSSDKVLYSTVEIQAI